MLVFPFLTQKSYLGRLMEIQRALKMSEFFKQHEVKTDYLHTGQTIVPRSPPPFYFPTFHILHFHK